MSRPGFFRAMFAPFGSLARFSGRTRRADFWPYILLLVAIYLVACVVAIGLPPRIVGSFIAPIYATASILILFAFAATVRRLHDVGWSGRWMAAYVVMAIAFIAFFFYWRYGVARRPYGEPGISLFPYMPLMMLFSLVMNGTGLLVFILSTLDGTPGPNRFGPDPKGREPERRPERG